MRILFLFAALIFTMSCGDKKSVTMTYVETHCSDVWLVHKTDDNTIEQAINIYFDSNHDIKLGNIDIDVVSTGPFCYACTCASGRIISVEVDEQFVTILEAEGFIRA
ncbi:MAG: hypothetical protein ACPG3Z_06325 [Saprospiraceae bacterium]